MRKSIPIGYEDLKEIIDKNLYYVDKTELIAELIDHPQKVVLFTRPRRFGKTLNLSMIRRFFEKELDPCGNPADNAYMFKDLKIAGRGNKYMAHQGQYPVINLSLKSAKQPDYDMAYEIIKCEIADEFGRHSYLTQADVLSDTEKERFRSIRDRAAEKIDYVTALLFLSKCLEKYHQKKVIILIDEYDVPLENAYFSGFYDRMTAFIRSLFESSLKTNPHLEFAVITGCLRISRESIFTGLNNLNIYSVQSIRYAEYFGFTEPETEEILSYYGLEHKLGELKHWYDGYRFGSTEIYNPWSVLQYTDAAVANPDEYPRAYWANTSSNSIIRELVEQADMETRQEIEMLIAGDTIEKPVHEDITYEDIHKTKENLWNFLYFTGYLREVGRRMEERTLYLTLSIPNEEIKYIYENTIREWFETKVRTYDFSEFYRAVLEEDTKSMEEQMKVLLRGSISYYDTQKKFYHGFLFGLLSGLQNYEIKSNRESGDGRPDIVLLPYDEQQPAVILELKYTKKITEMELLSKEALLQIKENHYNEDLLDEGYTSIISYGICFCKKTCRVQKCNTID